MALNRLPVEKAFYALDPYATQSWVEEKIEEAIDALPEAEDAPVEDGE